jgi:hypothetical protein
MSAALPHYNALDGRAAGLAGLSGALVHQEEILEIPTPVDPVDAGAVVADAFSKDPADALQQSLCLGLRYPVGGGKWVELCQVEGFIRIDVTQACQESLVQQQGFEQTACGLQAGVKILKGEGVFHRLGSQAAGHLQRVSHQPGAAKLARIVERQAQPLIQVQHQAVVRWDGCGFSFYQQVAAHAQVYQQPIRAELYLQHFPPARDCPDNLPGDALLEFGCRRGCQGAFPQQISLQDAPAQDGRVIHAALAQPIGNGLDFRQLGHNLSWLPQSIHCAARSS